ncbi:16S rRNA (adenine(1518)-N(6)/adenine(1519)-N(6))-dimethyltransferase RsmA [Raoultibacter phocaeensis]|uniref:16S rRNA (adenine(1518)-N(6)/adenine(1519)-N(6))- dimethyltransferase RsmA n=1 Tax=Raoultibacter phocaeensis TaxID=2479841 RepID=UPI0011187EA9|nr:16S rRNA (adenine(1518)-N(6)/adenine(1519)-N(6))-dimethyltransferase RsmA [Raoultibacter phocaeensis]
MTKLSPLATPSATRAVLEAHGLYTKKALGQNFLVNDVILEKIIAFSQVNERDFVLEVGPGIGTLTIALLKNAGFVVSVERDKDLPAVLDETLGPWADRFALVGKDALDLTATDLAQAAEQAGPPEVLAVHPMPNKFVANLPYAVAATLVLDYFERFESIESATVMVQSEVADRMSAKAGTKNYGAYTVKLSLFAEPAGRFSVSPGNFFPPPRVESSVLRLDRVRPVDDDGAPLDADALRATCTMAEAAFAARRKTIANSCKTYFASKGEQGSSIASALSSIFERAGIDPGRRGETLVRAEFIRLGKALHDASF